MNEEESRRDDERTRQLEEQARRLVEEYKQLAEGVLHQGQPLEPVLLDSGADLPPTILAEIAEKLAELPPATETESERTPPATAVEALLGKTGDEILTITRSRLSADDKMREICRIDRNRLASKSKEWAELLGVSEAAIRKTSFWKVDRPAALEALRRGE